METHDGASFDEAEFFADVDAARAAPAHHPKPEWSDVLAAAAKAADEAAQLLKLWEKLQLHTN